MARIIEVAKFKVISHRAEALVGEHATALGAVQSADGDLQRVRRVDLTADIWADVAESDDEASAQAAEAGGMRIPEFVKWTRNFAADLAPITALSSASCRGS